MIKLFLVLNGLGLFFVALAFVLTVMAFMAGTALSQICVYMFVNIMLLFMLLYQRSQIKNY